MKGIWPLASFASATAAAIQIFAVSGQVSHFTTIAWKTGIDPSGVITAGRTMIYVFFIASALCLSLALISEEKLRNQKSNFLYLSKLASLVLIVGMVIWGSMIASPYVIVANR